jgi:hypothetical protein
VGTTLIKYKKEANEDKKTGKIRRERMSTRTGKGKNKTSKE